jgi:hypothetical protein
MSDHEILCAGLRSAVERDGVEMVLAALVKVVAGEAERAPESERSRLVGIVRALQAAAAAS